MGIRKYAEGKVLPEEGDDAIVAKANWSDIDREALEAEMADGDDDEE